MDTLITGACPTELQEVLASLRTLMPEALRMMVGNFNRRTAGRFKTPMFAHSELDLARAFWAVQDKGGYDAVCAGKLWKVGMDVRLAVWQLKAQSVLASCRRHLRVAAALCVLPAASSKDWRGGASASTADAAAHTEWLSLQAHEVTGGFHRQAWHTHFEVMAVPHPLTSKLPCRATCTFMPAGLCAAGGVPVHGGGPDGADQCQLQPAHQL